MKWERGGYGEGCREKIISMQERKQAKKENKAYHENMSKQVVATPTGTWNPLECAKKSTFLSV